MRNLLSANFSRLWRSVWFWLCGLGMLGYTLWELSTLLHWVMGPNGSYPTDYLTSRIADFTLPLLLLMAMLCPLYLNGEYHDRAICNKLVVGRTRVQVYLANFLTMLAAALFYAAIHMLLSTGAVCLVKAHVWAPADTVGKLLLSLPYILSVTALFTLLGMLIRSRAVSVVAILLALGLLWLPKHLFRLLCASQQVPDIDTITMSEAPDENGEFSPVYWKDGQRVEEEQLEMMLNPQYVEEPLRSVYYFFEEALPGGQAFLISDMIAEHSPPGVLAVYALGLTGLSMFAGLLLFCRADLK